MNEKETLHAKVRAYVPTPPLGDIIPDVERLVKIGDASSIEPIRELLSRVEEVLWNDNESQTRRTETDFDIPFLDRRDIPKRIYELLEVLIFRIGEAEAGEYHGEDHAPAEAPPGAAPVHMSDFVFEVIGRRGARVIRRKESNRLRVWATEFDDAYGSQIEDFFSRGNTVSYAVTAYMVCEEGQEGGGDSYRLVMSLDDHQGSSTDRGNEMEFHKYVWFDDDEGKLISNSFELTNGFLWTKVGRSDQYWFLSMR